MLVVETADLELPDQVGDAGFLEPLHSLTGPIDIVDHDHQVVAERLDGFVLRLAGGECSEDAVLACRAS